MRIAVAARFAVLAVVVVSAGLVPSVVAAATTTIECGFFRDYTAPDPLGPTPGSITFGLHGAAEPIAPDAILTPPADTVLSSLAGGTPTCLTVVRDAGTITALAFAASGTVSGAVLLVPDLFGSGQDAYVIADRLFAPTTAVTSNPGLAALIKTAADSGSALSITFQIDLATGIPTGFTATTTLAGSVVLLGTGDVKVGAATLPQTVIDTAARAALAQASTLGVPATVVVDGVGTISQSSPGGVDIAITLSVSFVAPPTPEPSSPSPVLQLPNTATHPPESPSVSGGLGELAVLAGLASLAVGAQALTVSRFRRAR